MYLILSKQNINKSILNNNHHIKHFYASYSGENYLFIGVFRNILNEGFIDPIFIYLAL